MGIQNEEQLDSKDIMPLSKSKRKIIIPSLATPPFSLYVESKINNILYIRSIFNLWFSA